jgi:hypothetical protein
MTVLNPMSERIIAKVVADLNACELVRLRELLSDPKYDAAAHAP